jgi:hypothetical protein
LEPTGGWRYYPLGTGPEAPVEGSFAKSSLYINPNDLCSSPVSINPAKAHKVQAAKGLADAEQDVYTFNGMGKSFKFYIKADGTIVPTQYNRVIITSNIRTVNAGGTYIWWTALLEDGTKLDFGGAAGFVETTNFTKFDIGYTNVQTAWQLKQITSPNGEVVNFTYTGVAVRRSNYVSETDFLKYNTGVILGPPTQCLLYKNGGRRIKAEMQEEWMLQLSSIESALCRVDFELSAAEREDLLGSKALHKIKVYSKQTAQYLAVYQFNHAYSTAVASQEYNGQLLANELPSQKKRLKLMGLQKQDAAGTVENAWAFTYNPLNLPSRRSFAQDHWGFYNGKIQNNSLLPEYWYPLPTSLTNTRPDAGFNPPLFEQGVSREGDTAYIGAEVLQKITYPTGGASTFTFEANTTPIKEELFTAGNQSVQLNLTGTSNPFTTVDEKIFTTTVPQTILLNYSATISPQIFQDRPNTAVTITVIKQGGTTISGISTANGSGAKYINLRQSGVYILRISTNAYQNDLAATDAITANATVAFKQSLGFAVVNKPIGGLRLKKMVQYDAIDPTKNTEQNYTYENPLIIDPVDLQKKYFTQTEEYACKVFSGGNGGQGSPSVCNNIVVTRNSTTQFSLGSVQGGSVGYGKVTVTNGTSGAAGKTISTFSNEQDMGLDMTTTFPYVPVDARDWRRGQLLTQSTYTAANLLQKETTNTYQYLNKGSVASFKAGVFLNMPLNCGSTTICTEPFGDCGIQKVCYNTTSEQVNLVNTIEKMYDQNGTNPVTVTTNYYYDNPANPRPIRTEVVNSKGEVLQTITRTPLEKTTIHAVTPLSTSTLAAIDDMVAKNKIAPVLQTEQSNNANLVSRSLVNYAIIGGQFTQPVNMQVQKGSGPLEQRILFNSYDSYGNLLEQQKAADAPISYIYDYQNNYPIAEAIGAAQTDIAYTSFEADGKGNWAFAGSPTTPAGTAPTGKKVYALSSGSITKAVDAAKTYTVTLWANNATVTVNGSSAVRTGRTYGTYTLYEYEISGSSSVAVSGTGNIDELRLYPQTAMMATYTFTPLIGVTTQCDSRNNILYFEYDNFNRLRLVRDMDGNVVKKMAYGYQQ